MRKILLVFLIQMLLLFSVSSQMYEGGIPYTFNKNLKEEVLMKSSGRIKSITLPQINNEKEKQIADSLAESRGHQKNKFFGKGFDVETDITKAHAPVILDNGRKLWLIKIHSENAYGMHFYFRRFKLPRGATLYLYNEEKDMILGAFTKNNNNENNNFGTQFIQGKSIYMEYTEPAEPEYNTELILYKAVHIFTDIFQKKGAWGESEACNINIKCPLGDEWQEEASSVALILSYNSSVNYSGWCSGALLNNTLEDARPYFLTAKHCCDTTLGDAFIRYDYSSWVFLFNYESEHCIPEENEVVRSKSSVYGSRLLSDDMQGSQTSDYALLELSVAPNALSVYNVAYAGWEKEESNAQQSLYSVCIHHPSGDVKKVSKDHESPVSSSFWGTTGNHWGVTWDEGTTEQMSSGSPLFNSEHRLIGQLHGGWASCNAPDLADHFGKFSVSWREGGFDRWLDPAESGATHVDTYRPEESKTEGLTGTFYAYPNPVDNYLRVVINSVNADKYTIEIMDAVGKRVEYRKTLHSNFNDFDFTNISPGIYYVYIRGTSLPTTFKVLNLP